MRYTINCDEFKNMSFRELCHIPIEELKKKDYDLYLQLYCTMDDSSIYLEDECPY